MRECLAACRASRMVCRADKTQRQGDIAMADTAYEPQSIAKHYCFPESTYRQLCEMRDRLQALADLAAGSDPGEEPIKVDPMPLFACFGSFASELGDVLDRCHAHSPRKVAKSEDATST
jgi:hypothetical protein